MVLCPNSNEIRRVYEMVDENGDGKVTVTEMNHYLKRLGLDISEEDLKYVIAPIILSCHEDQDAGTLTFDEFVSLYHSNILVDNRSEEQLNDGDGCEDLMREVFKVYDINNDGFISSTELQHVLCNLGLMQGEELGNCKKMIGTFDSDSNGLLDFTEFKIMMTSNTHALFT